eukprot:gene50595-61889_t
MRARITDPSFIREKHPSGISFEMLCPAHSDAARPGGRAEGEEQRQLRAKYRIQLKDLEGFPGHQKKKKRKGRKKDGAGGEAGGEGTGRGRGMNAAGTSLSPDPYPQSLCACCMRSFNADVFHSGFDPRSLLLGEGLAIQGTSRVECAVCGLSLHAQCAGTSGAPAGGFVCHVCRAGGDYAHVSCALCPRRGGFFLPLLEGSSWGGHTGYAHAYCAYTSLPPGYLRRPDPSDALAAGWDGRTEVYELRAPPKDSTPKGRCGICNCKGGAQLPCAAIGCALQMHLLCA